MIILQLDFDKYSPEQLQLTAEQIRHAMDNEQVLVIPKDVNFIHDLTDDQLKVMKKIIEKELEDRSSNDL